MASYEAGFDPRYGYNKNAFAHGTLGTKVAGTILKVITTPIGLTSEAVQSYRDRSRSVPDAATGSLSLQCRPTVQGAPSGNDLGDFHAAADEADWALDEVAAETGSKAVPAFDTKPPSHVPSRLDAQALEARLPFPVIIPQRRPGTKSRGFVRAYAPCLAAKAIDQDRFLGFLRDFHGAAQANPIFNVVMIATALAGAYPDPIVAASVQAVQILAGLGQEVQERWRTNKFLEQANKELFMPRGLFAMIVAHQPAQGDEDKNVEVNTVDIGATAFAKYGAAELEASGFEAKKRELKDRLRVGSARTVGEAEMPVTCAQLIFPALEAAAATASKDDNTDKTAVLGIKSASKDACKWLNEYYDRRAQATYKFHNPNTTLSNMTPKTPEFKSRLADPNHALNTHLITLLSGGKIKAEPLGAKRRWKKAQQKAAEKRAQGLKVTPAKRLLQEDVLYLMIVNMPSDQELASARQVSARASAKGTL